MWNIFWCLVADIWALVNAATVASWLSVEYLMKFKPLRNEGSWNCTQHSHNIHTKYLHQNLRILQKKNNQKCSTGCPKKAPHKEMCDFLTLKMLPLALALMKPKKCQLLAPLVKNPPFCMRIYGLEQFPM